jgi:DNA polymerase-3 subunit delta'
VKEESFAVLERLASEPERFPGALLLTGDSDARLESQSRRLAARLLCPGRDPDASCGSCRRVLEGFHPDFLTVEPEGVQIRVDRVREAIAFGAGQPYEAPRRVARLLRADTLGVEGANALLKSLEEPGARFRWILTTMRPESLLATIRSRTTAVSLPARGRQAREQAFRDLGFSEDDARDLVVLAPASDEAGDPPPAAEQLAEWRERRQAMVAALEEGLSAGRSAALVALAEAVASLERSQARLLPEILADAAVALEAPDSGALRHRPVAGKLAEIARRTGPGALIDAAIAAADPPPDNRRGNKRLHYEKVLLDLWAKRSGPPASSQ